MKVKLISILHIEFDITQRLFQSGSLVHQLYYSPQRKGDQHHVSPISAENASLSGANAC